MRATFAIWVIALAACGGTRSAASITPRGESTLALIEARSDLDGNPVGTDGSRATIAIMMASWCPHCHDELAVIDHLRASHPSARILGLNYRGHEEYDRRGSPEALRTYLTAHAPWLRVVPADEALFAALGRPPSIPSIYIYNRDGRLLATFERSQRPAPDEHELAAVLAKAGA